MVKSSNKEKISIFGNNSKNKLFLFFKERLLDAFVGFPDEKIICMGKVNYPEIDLSIEGDEGLSVKFTEELSNEIEASFNIYHPNKNDLPLVISFINRFIKNLKKKFEVSYYQYFIFEELDDDWLKIVENDKDIESKEDTLRLIKESSLEVFNEDENWLDYNVEKLTKILNERDMISYHPYPSKKRATYLIHGTFTFSNPNLQITKKLEKPIIVKNKSNNQNYIEIKKYEEEEFMDVIHHIQEITYDKFDENLIMDFEELINLNKDNFKILVDIYELYFIYNHFGDYYIEVGNKEKANYYYQKCLVILNQLKENNDALFEEDEYNEILEKLK